MPLIQTKGAASSQGFGEFTTVVPNYIEDVFSTYLYTGNGSTQTITNGIDLAGKGGLVWTKSRSNAASHAWIDSARGKQYLLRSDTTDAQITSGGADYISSFNANGYTVSGGWGLISGSGQNYVSWTFREQPKFFDVVTYTGTGSAQNIAHSLGSVPGCVIVKITSGTGSWYVYHRSNANTQAMLLNGTQAVFTDANAWNSTTPTSTQFTVGASASTNNSGSTYVAYLFAHNAGGFGLTGTDNVISCGSFTTDGSGSFTPVSLGYEPQWLLIKNSSGAQDWILIDSMRGFNYTAGSDVVLSPNTSAAEGFSGIANPNATGFGPDTSLGLSASSTYIYIAIRRGPMKVPTTGTSVFTPVTYTGTGSAQSITNLNFPPDLVMGLNRTSGISLSGVTPAFIDRLRGVSASGTPQIFSSNTSSETNTTEVSALTMTGFTVGSVTSGNWNYSSSTYVAEMFQRAPGFFDEVCYTGDNATNRQVAHNLGVTPELIIVKSRTGIDDWMVRWSGNTSNNGRLNSNLSFNQSNLINGESSTMFQLANNSSQVNNSSFTYVAYLFATCPGVSKVGSYTGTGTTLQINCGFTGGARFVLIKRTDSTGDWVLWDSSRGMVAGTDPRLALNSTAAEVNANWVYTTTGGFEIVTSDAAVNASGGSYIFLSIA
jgi:hypothetical protein